MKTSVCPKLCKNLKITIPMIEPKIPPNINTDPILKSTFLCLACDISQAIDEAVIWFAEVETATKGGIPINIRRGVAIKPPPMPNIPDNIPVIKPRDNINNILIGISAIGRYICNAIFLVWF